MNSNVSTPSSVLSLVASAMTFFTSLTLEEVADNSMNLLPDCDASILAMVVLPTPGGPVRMMDEAADPDIMLGGVATALRGDVLDNASS